jgi:hypothetical protein
MRLTLTSAALALCFALPAPVPAYAFDASSAAVHEHTRHAHHAARAEISPNALALAPTWAMSSADRVKETDGLSRNPDDCNYGCIDQ